MCQLSHIESRIGSRYVEVVEWLVDKDNLSRPFWEVFCALSSMNFTIPCVHRIFPPFPPQNKTNHPRISGWASQFIVVKNHWYQADARAWTYHSCFYTLLSMIPDCWTPKLSNEDYCTPQWPNDSQRLSKPILSWLLSNPSLMEESIGFWMFHFPFLFLPYLARLPRTDVEIFLYDAFSISNTPPACGSWCKKWEMGKIS